MSNLSESIEALLHLQAPLPRSLTSEILLNNAPLLDLHDQFVDIASELRLWSFYETRESSLSGSSAASANSEVQFGAPLVSVKSALLDLWQEDVYAVDSDHAHLASFGPHNSGILASYLEDLAAAIRKAAALSRAYTHVPLHLRDHVKVEVIGFYEDPDALMGSPRTFAMENSGEESGSIIRLYSTKHSFREFLKKGPDGCLAERLHKVPRRRASQHRLGPSLEHEGSWKESRTDEGGSNPLGTAKDSSLSATSQWHSPDILVTRPTERPMLLRVPAQSEPIVRPPSPESNASISTTMSDSALPYNSGHGETEHHTVGLLAKQHAGMLMKEHEFAATAGFSRPNPDLRKFMWIHLPFNNPVWVKVRIYPCVLGTCD
jgi:hypothetical protein